MKEQRTSFQTEHLPVQIISVNFHLWLSYAKLLYVCLVHVILYSVAIISYSNRTSHLYCTAYTTVDFK